VRLDHVENGKLDDAAIDRGSSRTLEKGLAVLSLFDVDHREWSFAEIRGRIALPKTTTLRLVKTLEKSKYLERDAETGRYHLGSGILRATYAALSYSELARVADPFMRALARSTTESTGLSIWTDQGPLLIHTVLTTRPFKPHMPAGMLFPGFGTADSRVHVAFGPTSRWKAALALPQQKRTEHTITDPHALEDELLRVHKEGVAIEVEEWNSTMGAVAAPVFSGGREAIACLTIVAQIERCTSTDVARYVEAVKKTAAEISAALGYQRAGD
jgi:DNA-binding IclR family transcriptional regulator